MTHNYNKHLELMDTTLRDGEQTPGVSYSPEEKLQITRILLDKVGVDRIEIASARVSEGEREGALKTIQWAQNKNKDERIEILGFVDKGKSIDWIKSVDGKVVNLLTKGSETHCRGQLRKTPEKHYREVCEVIDYAVSKGILVNVYLEDWSSGMRDSFHYVYEFMRALSEHQVERIMLPDTLGILEPDTLRRYLDWMISAFPSFRYDYHGHNDYGLSTANCLVAAKSGLNGVHVTVNGLGERTGNTPLYEIVAAINDMSDRKIKINEKQLDYVAKTVQAISGKRLSANTPIVGDDVFTQTCGVHADGDKKGNLYANQLIPERFGRKRQYALGKLSGKASIDKNLEEIGLELEQDVRDRILQEVIRLGDKKKKVTREDLPFIIADVLKTNPEKKRVEFINYNIVTKRNSLPFAEIEIRVDDTSLQAKAKGDGGYDAFMKAVRKALRGTGVKPAKLLDYEVCIPPGGKTDALVETTITWGAKKNIPLVTIGVDCDQIEAAIQATEKMLNLVIEK